VHSILQSIFSVAVRRRKLLRDIADAERRAGALKMDWTEPLHDARPMCIEWLAEGWSRGCRSAEEDVLAADMRR
jgi:hypothetical protein